MDELSPPTADDVAVLGVEFHRPAHTARPLAGYQRRAAAAERVEDDITTLRRVAYR